MMETQAKKGKTKRYGKIWYGVGGARRGGEGRGGEEAINWSSWSKHRESSSPCT